MSALFSGLWGLVAGLALAAAAVALLAGGPGRPAFAALSSFVLGAAVVGGFWVGNRREHGLDAGQARDGEAHRAAEPSALAPFDARQAPVASGADAVEVARLEALFSALPELGLLMDDQGRADVVFGRPLPGIDASALHAGLASLASLADRNSVLAALRQASDGAPSEIVFALVATPQRRLRLSLSKTPDGRVAGLLMEAPPASSPDGAAQTRTEADQRAQVDGGDLAAESGALVAAPSPNDAALEAAQKAKAAAETERDAAKAENAAKSRFLANMSHELRTPLNAIIGFSDIMRTKLFGPLPERYAEYAELIHESGHHLTDLINDVLDMSKLEAERYELQREVFDAREPIESALKLLRLQADDKGVHLRGDLPSAPLTVDADRRAVKQIVLNLVSNALKFTPPEGRIDVTLRAFDGAMELVVADTGVGIAAEDLKRLGTPYEQTDAGRRAQGTGLGLSLVKALTALHGGEFSLESRLGEGSAATVRLPVLVKAQPAIAPPEAANH